MKIEVNLSKSNQTKKINLRKNSEVFDLLKKLDIKPHTAVVLRNKIPIPEDEQLKENDILHILQVSSSG